MRRFLGPLAVMVLLMVGLTGAPAQAIPTDVGVLSGVATVGKSRVVGPGGLALGDCVVFGGGLGLPLLNDNKNAYWELSPMILATAGHGMGVMDLCGRLTSVPVTPSGGVAIGASCGLSKGWDGSGAAFFPAPPGGLKAPTVVFLTDVGWKLSVGATLPVLGRAFVPAKSPALGLLVGVIQAGSGFACFGKGGGVYGGLLWGPKPNPVCVGASGANAPCGAQTFTVVGAFAVTDMVSFDWNDLPFSPPGSNNKPVFCKAPTPGPTLCYYPPKKMGKSG